MKLLQTMMVSIIVLSVVSAEVFADNHYKDMYVFRSEMSLLLKDLDIALAQYTGIQADNPDKEKALTKGLLLFRRVLLIYTEDAARAANSYLQALYDNGDEYHDPVMLSMVGATRAMIGGTLKNPNPIPKLSFLGEGITLLDQAIAEQTQRDANDNVALGYIYFMRGNTVSRVPGFLDVSKDAPGNLKTSLMYFKKLKALQKEPGYGDIIANIYFSYGLYYLNQGKIRLALKNMKKGKRYASTNVQQYLQQKIDALQ